MKKPRAGTLLVALMLSLLLSCLLFVSLSSAWYRLSGDVVLPVNNQPPQSRDDVPRGRAAARDLRPGGAAPRGIDSPRVEVVHAEGQRVRAVDDEWVMERLSLFVGLHFEGLHTEYGIGLGADMDRNWEWGNEPDLGPAPKVRLLEYRMLAPLLPFLLMA